jgi:hypothetical protein
MPTTTFAVVNEQGKIVDWQWGNGSRKDLIFNNIVRAKQWSSWFKKSGIPTKVVAIENI